MIATLQFDLSNPDDEQAHRWALAGRDALIALERLGEELRSRTKYGEISDETRSVLEELRALIPYELTSLLV
jgi:hypothetical protein